MSPRRGGEAAKFGARFEGRWTTVYLIDVLMGRVDRVTVEAVDPEAEAVEFFVLRDNREEGHQAKRQWQDRTNWTLHLLGEQGILDAAATMVRGGRDFHFVSTLPAQPLSDLAEVARRSGDFASFSALITGNKKSRDGFDVLAKRWAGPQEAWEVLRHIDVSSPDERQLQKTNAALAQVLFEGEPEPAVAVLAEIANDNLGVPLTGDRLWSELEARGVRPNPLRDERNLAAMIVARTDRFLSEAQGAMLQPPISRTETEAAIDALGHGHRVVVLAGEAGTGKSAVVAAIVEACVIDGRAVLAFRLDRYMDVRSSRQLGQALDLPASPAVALAGAAAGRLLLLVIDQLDAVSLASGRSSEVFAVVEELLIEAERFPNLQVLLACRRYDIDNDHRLKALADPNQSTAAKVIDVARLDRKQVEHAVSKIGLDPARLGSDQIELLRLPLNLVLLREVASEEDALSFGTTRDLLDLFWITKRRAVLARRAGVRFERVIELVVEEMNSSQRLTVPRAVLEAENLDDDADVLASEHVIVRDGRQISFFHETLFDYAFARQWISRKESVLDFLLSGEQELFRRAQVRQVLLHLRGADCERFVRELRTLLLDIRVRFQVKDSVLTLARALTDPTEAELQLMLELLEEGSPLHSRVELLLRTAPWFNRLDTAGLLAEWLASGEAELEERAVTIVGAAGDERAARVGALLAPYTAHANFAHWLFWVGRFVGLEKDRGLFELFLTATQTGLFNDHEDTLFLTVHSVGDKAPEWGAELLLAWFAERPTALELVSGQVRALQSADHGLLELIQKSADKAPITFVELLLPYMQTVMAIAEQGDRLPRSDWHFSSEMWTGVVSQADDMLMHSMVRALRAVATADPTRLLKLVAPLVDDPHAAAQDLLYEALAASGGAHAEWAAQLLLRGGSAVESGYGGSSYWRTRELLHAITPHLIDESFAAVEALVASFDSEWERAHPPSRGYTAFVLLSALPEERLSESARRRLGELRRKFKRDQPEPPRSIIAGFVGPPIPEARTEYMTDEQWIGAMRKHADDEGDWQTFELRGGARELAHVLKAATMKEPERFARFALRLDASFNRHYLEGILIGLGDTPEDVEPDLVYEVIRHAAVVGDHDRWLSWPLKRLYKAHVPDDIIEIVLARALGLSDLIAAHATTGATEEPGDMGDAFTSGLNTERGGNAHTLAVLVAFDPDGARAAIVAPHLEALASDPSPAVRACVAGVIHGMLRWHREAALHAFATLARDRDPQLVTTSQFEEVAVAVILTDVELALAVIEDLLVSDDSAVREHGARLATFAATDAERTELLDRVALSNDAAMRKGAARVLAARVRWIDEPAVRTALTRLFDDRDETVREAAATFVGNLRGESLANHKELLSDFITSRASEDSTQLMITLEYAPVPDHELTLQIARRVIDAHAAELGDIRTASAGDARYLTRLVLRSYSLTENSAMRAQLLDVIDRLLELGAFGIADAIDEARR